MSNKILKLLVGCAAIGVIVTLVMMPSGCATVDEMTPEERQQLIDTIGRVADRVERIEAEKDAEEAREKAEEAERRKEQREWLERMARELAEAQASEDSGTEEAQE